MKVFIEQVMLVSFSSSKKRDYQLNQNVIKVELDLTPLARIKVLLKHS